MVETVVGNIRECVTFKNELKWLLARIFVTRKDICLTFGRHQPGGSKLARTHSCCSPAENQSYHLFLSQQFPPFFFLFNGQKSELASLWCVWSNVGVFYTLVYVFSFLYFMCTPWAILSIVLRCLQKINVAEIMCQNGVSRIGHYTGLYSGEIGYLASWPEGVFFLFILSPWDGIMTIVKARDANESVNRYDWVVMAR